MDSRRSAKKTDARQQFEDGLVGVFAELADLFGNPRSHGQIYGLLFTSVEPLSMEQITERLGISLGAVSQGLRALEDLGVVDREVRSRFGYYSARLELKTLINGFIRQRLVPRLEKSSATLKELAPLVDSMPGEDGRAAAQRLQRVTQWHRRAVQFLPLAELLLGGKSAPRDANGKTRDPGARKRASGSR